MPKSRKIRDARIRRNKQQASRDKFLRNSVQTVQLALNVCSHSRCSDCPEMDKCRKQEDGSEEQ